MTDIRTNWEDLEEALRVHVNAQMRGLMSNLRAVVATDSTDGHTVSLQPVTQANIRNPDGSVSPQSLPVIPDCPIQFTGGGGITTTHPVKMGDEGSASISSMPLDVWHQLGNTQPPIDGRLHALSDATYHPGGRSDPRKLAQVSTDAHHVRSDDKRNVSEMHPQNGATLKMVDPSTQAASANFDPFTQASKFFSHIIHPTNGHSANATDGDTTHSTALSHLAGFLASIANGKHTIGAHPDNGTSISSSVAHTLQAPNATLDKDGNQTNQGSSTSQGNITSASGNISAPSGLMSALSGAFSSFSGGGFGGNNGVMTAGGTEAAPNITIDLE